MSNTQKVPLPLGTFMMESGLGSVTAERSREDYSRVGGFGQA